MYFFTSEAVTEGHPDKICDQISDAILDAALKKDVASRVACEVAITKDLILIMGEISTKAKIDYKNIAKKVITSIGYNKETFDVESTQIIVKIHEQSPEIARGVNKNNGDVEQGAGDQGIMFGYATNETAEMLPLSFVLSKKLAHQLTKVRKNNTLPYLCPDGKTQVTVAYTNGKTPYIDTVVISTQHTEYVTNEKLHEDLMAHVIKKTFSPSLLQQTKYYINPTGRFILGGPNADAGLTGRKIIADTYGGYARHGGGAFSGKDPSKVDRSAAYMARYIAKNIVAANLANKVEIQLSYAIGVSEPLSVFVETFGTEKVKIKIIEKVITEVFDLRPRHIIEQLKLLNPIYLQTANSGHFGNDIYTWEKADKVAQIKQIIQNLNY